MLYRVEGDREGRGGEIRDSFAKEFSVADTFYKSILTFLQCIYNLRTSS